MLRRTTDVNLPSLTRYLSAHFPEIPMEWHVPVIISSFTAAQKVAATYAEAVLSVEDERTVSAKRSMTRWLHGLSAVEPGRSSKLDNCKESGISSAVSSEADGYSPSTNYLLNRQLPVPLGSTYQQQQLDRELNAVLEVSQTSSSSASTDILSSFAVQQVLSMPTIPMVTDAVTSSNVYCQLLNESLVTSDMDGQILVNLPAQSYGDTLVNTDVGHGQSTVNLGVSLANELQSTTIVSEFTSSAVSTATTPASVEENVLINVQSKISSVDVSELQIMSETVSSVAQNDDRVQPTSASLTPKTLNVEASSTETTDINCDLIENCSFDDMLNSMDGLTDLLPVPLTPLHTPTHHSDDRHEEETIIQLHPSPSSILEEHTSPVRGSMLDGKENHSPGVKKSLSSIAVPVSLRRVVKRLRFEEDAEFQDKQKNGQSKPELSLRGKCRDQLPFKVPLKPVQKSTPRRPEGSTSSTHRRDRTDDRNRRDVNRSKSSSSSQDLRHSGGNHSSWSAFRHHSTSFRPDQLTEQQRRWLKQMPSSWRY